MSKNLEDLFVEEVRRRSNENKRRVGLKIVLSCLITGTVGFFIFSIIKSSNIGTQKIAQTNKSSSLPKAVPNPPTSIKPPQFALPTIAPTAIPYVKSSPVALPKTGILRKYSFIPHEKFGRIRVFLRPPLAKEKSSLRLTCGNKNLDMIKKKNHRFIEFVDWKSDEIITTAFIRSGEMLEIFLPLGSYKLRYAAGTKWYGEKNIFGSKYMYEMTEKLSSKPFKLELTMKNRGGDIGAYCANGNLGHKRIRKDLHQESLPLPQKDKFLI